MPSSATAVRVTLSPTDAVVTLTVDLFTRRFPVELTVVLKDFT